MEQTTQASQELHAASGALLRAMASFRLDADQGTPAAAAGEPQPRRSPLVLARPEDSGIAAA